jgi:hypothetical protein
MNDASKTAAAGPAANQQLEHEIDRLAVAIQRFRVDSQRFFAGDLKLPPDELREKIAANIRRLRNRSLRGASVNFRLGTLEAQFQSHLDLFGRRLRVREEADARAFAQVAKPAPDPKRGVVLGTANDGPAVEALYRGLHNPTMDLERFRVYIERQAEAIRDKTNCREIQFRIAVQGGKMKLKARPIRRQSSA